MSLRLQHYLMYGWKLPYFRIECDATFDAVQADPTMTLIGCHKHVVFGKLLAESGDDGFEFPSIDERTVFQTEWMLKCRLFYNALFDGAEDVPELPSSGPTFQLFSVWS